jgi:hypothetical protein
LSADKSSIWRKPGPRARRLRPILMTLAVVLALGTASTRMGSSWVGGVIVVLISLLGIYSYLIARELDSSFGSAQAPWGWEEWGSPLRRAFRSLLLVVAVVGVALIPVMLLYYAGVFKR